MRRKRKMHADELGYIAECCNPLFTSPAPKVVIYYAEKQRIGTQLDLIGATKIGAAEYATVCDYHGQVGGFSSLPKARAAMKHPDKFCTSCRAIVEMRGGRCA